MDTTRIDALLNDLEETDAADAPEVADAVARTLSEHLERGAAAGEHH